MACTVTNLAITIVVSVAIWFVSPIAAIVVFVVSCGLIYLRGYLVPGTPRLTKRYFPRRLLRLFGKDEELHGVQSAIDGGQPEDPDRTPSIDAEAVLIDTGIIHDSPETGDVEMAPAFERVWEEKQPDDVSPNRESVQTILGEGEYEVKTLDSEAAVAHVEGTVIGQWPSKAALESDIGSARALSESYEGWNNLDASDRAALAGSLRAVVETCPVCDARVELNEEEHESCCSTYTVVSMACVDCEDTLLEFDASALA